MRNHVETILEFLKKSEFDSRFHRATRDDLERARAREVHKSFFPDEELSIPGLVCGSFYKPVHSIGGDYYDFLPLRDECWGIAIGDVCGKGIGAARASVPPVRVSSRNACTFAARLTPGRDTVFTQI